MHHSTLAARLLAGGLLSLVLASTAAAELTKQECYTARIALAGALYARTAACDPDTPIDQCMIWANAPHEAWSNALTAQGCPPWPSESGLVVTAYFARIGPPRGFWDDCGVEEGVCGGTCAEPFHECREAAGGCACVSTLPPGN